MAWIAEDCGYSDHEYAHAARHTGADRSRLLERLFLLVGRRLRLAALVLDETFGALDPHTTKSCLEVVTRRAPSLVVIAHP